MRYEWRRWQYRTSLLIFPETDEEKRMLDEVAPLDTDLRAELKLADGYAEYYAYIEGINREPT